jgi:hypothetical protein
LTAGAWTLVNASRADIIAGTFATAATFKVALFTSTAAFTTASTVYSTTNELTTANGYTAGGVSVTLTETGTTSVAVYFVTNPTWTASGGSLVARYALLYAATTPFHIVAFCLLDNTPADVTVTTGNTLTIKSDNTSSNPVYTMA